MALIMPVVVTLIFGILQFGYAFMVQHALQDAARQGCRAGVVPSRSNTAVTSTVNGLLTNEGVIVNNTTTTILVNNVAGNVALAQAGDDVCVKIAIPLSAVALFPNYFSNFTGTLTGTASLRCE